MHNNEMRCAACQLHTQKLACCVAQVVEVDVDLSSDRALAKNAVSAQLHQPDSSFSQHA